MDERAVEEISPEEVRQNLEEGSSPLFIDVRRPEVYDKSSTRISGARRIQPDAIGKNLSDLPKGREIVIY